MDVQLPDGRVLQGVPEGTTKAQLAAKLQANGMAVPKAWMEPTAPARPMVQTPLGAMPRVPPEQLRREIETDPRMKKIADVALGFLPITAGAGAAKALGFTEPKGPLDAIAGLLGRFKKPMEPATAALSGHVKEAVETGYKVSPEVARVGGLPEVVSAIGDPAKVAQSLSLRNQENTNALVRKALGLPSDAYLTPDVLNAVRKRESAPYKEIVDALGDRVPLGARYLKKVDMIRGRIDNALKDFPDVVKNVDIDGLIAGMKGVEREGERYASANGILEAIRSLRAQSGRNLHMMAAPEKQALGVAQKEAANALEWLMEDTLKKSGQEGLATAFRAARQKIAQTYDVEAALNASTGNVSARYLGQLFDKGKPLSGELKTIAQTAQRFPQVMKSADGMGDVPMFTPWDARLAAIEAEKMGHLGGLSAFLMARPAARALVGTEAFQRRLAGTAPAPTVSPAGQLMIQLGLQTQPQRDEGQP